VQHYLARRHWPTWGIKLSGKPPLARDRPVRGAVGIAVNCLETLTADWNRYRLDEEGVNRRTIFRGHNRCRRDRL